MWFKLNTTFTTSLGKLSELTNSWPITRYLTNFTTTSNVLNVEKESAYEAVFTIGANCTVDAAPSVTMSGIAVSASQAVWNASAGTLTVKISSVTGPVVITASATKNSTSSGGAGGSGGTPTNYTFTINPTPTSATVTLSATGYSTVSGTGSKSITVANGTKVNWSVSASGYTTRTGSWTISGGNKTENIKLSATSGGGGTGGDTSNLLTENPYFVTTGMPTQMTNSSYGTKIGYDYGGFICKGIKSASTGKGNSFNVYAGAKGSNGLVENVEKVGTFTYTKEKGTEEEFLFNSPIDLTGDTRLTCNGSFMWRQSTTEEQNNPPQGVRRLQTNTPLYYYWYIFQ